jgi:glycosyltransferase involved in cell wall biosynthesis
MSYSVIIPAYNRPEMLKRALASVYKQTILPDAIYLVIDEPNNAEKYLFLNDYDQRLVATFTGGGYGGAKARNVGLDQAKEEYVFFLDDDDEWLPKKVEKQLAVFVKDPSICAVTCSCWEIFDHCKRLVRRSTLDVNRYGIVSNLIGGFSNFGFRRHGELVNIRLNPELKSAQDYEFYIRVSVNGKIGVVEDPSVNFYHHEGVRITNETRTLRRATWYTILYDNLSLFSARERRFYIAKVELLTACDSPSLMRAVLQYIKGFIYIITALKYPWFSLVILNRGARGILQNVVRR